METQALEEWENHNTVTNMVYTAKAETNDTKSYLHTDPQNLQDTLSRPDCNLWINAMTDEIQSLQENDTWELVKHPIDRDIIDPRWVFYIKKHIDGSIEK